MSTVVNAPPKGRYRGSLSASSRTLGLAAMAAGAVLLSGLDPASADSITIQQYFSPAPNFYGSPSWSGYLANAMNSLQNGLGNIGNPATDPTAYQQLDGTYTPGMAEVTSYPSWLGEANPPSPFASELGNRLHAGVVITDTGGTFDLQDVSFAFHSSDGPGCASLTGGSLCYEGDLSGTNFGSGTRIGINFGADGVLGGGDDTVYDVGNAGDETTQINELIYVGVGNAFWPGGGDPDPSNPLLGPQGAIDDTSNYILANKVGISNEYCVKGTCDTASLSVVPEPLSGSLLATALFGLGVVRRRRRR